jgi:hypothetical protein
VNYYALLHKAKPSQGQVVEAYVLSVRQDGKINVSLRPVGYDKVRSARAQVLALLEGGDYNGVLPVGDKSTPEQVLGPVSWAPCVVGHVPTPLHPAPLPMDGRLLTSSIMYCV